MNRHSQSRKQSTASAAFTYYRCSPGPDRWGHATPAATPEQARANVLELVLREMRDVQDADAEDFAAGRAAEMKAWGTHEQAAFIAEELAHHGPPRSAWAPSEVDAFRKWARHTCASKVPELFVLWRRSFPAPADDALARWVDATAREHAESVRRGHELEDRVRHSWLAKGWRWPPDHADERRPRRTTVPSLA